MQGFITIKEASQLTGKHADTIRRLIKENKDTKYVAKDRKGRLIIDSQWLATVFEPTEAPTSPDNSQDTEQTTPHSQTSLEPVINALTSQLNAKDQQIANLQSLLSEKEANTTKLQDQFQQLLARQQLPADVTKSDTTQPAYAEPMASTEPAEANREENLTKPNTTRPKKTSKKPIAKKPVKSLKKPQKPKTKKTPSKPQVAKPTPKPKKKWWKRTEQ